MISEFQFSTVGIELDPQYARGLYWVDSSIHNEWIYLDVVKPKSMYNIYHKYTFVMSRPKLLQLSFCVFDPSSPSPLVSK